MDEQNPGGQPPAGGWSPVGQNPQQPGSYTPPSYGAPPVPPPNYAAGSGQYPPPPPPPPPPGNYGSAPGGYPPPPGQPPYGQPPYGQPPAGQGMTPNTAAAVAYITFIPAVIFLAIDPYKQINFVRFHAWQSIVLTGVAIAVHIAFMILAFLPLHFLWFLFSLVHLAISLALFVFWLVAIIKASRGERYHIPGVGPIAENFTGRA